MSNQTIELAYEGEAVAHKTMDVTLLAPALLGFGELCVSANKVLGCAGEVRVSVHSDFQQKCFLIGFDVSTAASGIWGQVKSILENEDVKAAQELLSWLGIIAAPVTYPLLKYIQMKKGKVVKDVEAVDDENVRVTFHGDNNSVTIHKHVYNLGENPAVLSSLAKVTKPLLEEGFTELQLRHKGKPQCTLNRSDASHIRSLAKALEEDLNVVKTTIYVESPSFDPATKKWTFRFLDRTAAIDISETTIAADTIKRGGAFVGDAYRVYLQIKEKPGKNGSIVSYKVLEVLDYIPGSSQQDWVDEDS